MEELSPQRLALASPMNIFHQPINRRFLVKWSHFWMALLLNFSTNTSNHSTITIKRISTSIQKLRKLTTLFVQSGYEFLRGCLYMTSQQ